MDSRIFDMTLYEWLKSEKAQREWAKFNIVDDMHKIICPALSLVGRGEGEGMLKQTKEFNDGISSENKIMHEFTLAKDGAHDHCMLDNHSRMGASYFQVVK